MSYPQVFIMGGNKMSVPSVKTMLEEEAVKEALEAARDQHMSRLFRVHGVNPKKSKISTDQEKILRFSEDLKRLDEQHKGFLNMDRTLRETINLLEGNDTKEATEYRERLVNLQEQMVNFAGEQINYKKFKATFDRSMAQAGLDSQRPEHASQKFKEPLTTGKIGGKDFYQDAEFQTSFKKYLPSEYSAENGDFLLALYNLQNNTTDSLAKKVRMLDDIFNQYIVPAAKNQINLASATFANLMADKTRPEGLSISSFNGAVKEIEGLLGADTFKRFQTWEAKVQAEAQAAKPEKSGLQAIRDKITARFKSPEKKTDVDAQVVEPPSPKAATTAFDNASTAASKAPNTSNAQPKQPEITPEQEKPKSTVSSFIRSKLK